MPKFKKKFHEKAFGSERVLLPGQTPKQFEKLNKEWAAKLKASGFVDIEVRNMETNQTLSSLSTTGVSIAGSTQNIIRRLVNTRDTAEYFRMCAIFYHHADFKKLFKSKAALLKRMFDFHANGASYREIAKYFRSSQCPDKWRRPKASEFWTHWTLEPVIQAMFEWHRTDPEGLWFHEGSENLNQLSE